MSESTPVYYHAYNLTVNEIQILVNSGSKNAKVAGFFFPILMLDLNGFLMSISKLLIYRFL